MKERIQRLAVWLAPHVPLLLALAAVLLYTADAAARVGGGQSFGGGGGRRSSGGSYSGGGGGGDGDLIFFLIWMCIEHPVIGIPLLIVVAGVVLFKMKASGGVGERSYHSHHAPAPPRRPTLDIGSLREADPNFSEPLFLDFVQLVYTRAQELRPRKDKEPLRPYLGDKALTKLEARSGGLERVQDVIFGATSIREVRTGPQWSTVVVAFTTNLTEVRGGKAQQLLLEERWSFRRRTGVLSPGPERMRVLSCAACGSTLDPNPDGRCPSCDSIRTGGQIQWEAFDVEVLQSRPLQAPDLHLGGGVEEGTNWPTVKDPDLPARRRALQARHPDFDLSLFEQKIEKIFLSVQASWSEQKWERARPYETDALFQVHRFWIERYGRFGLRNRLEDVEVLKMELARIDMDAFFESITIRIWARMRDWTEKTATGEVLGGSKTELRTFSEYWTFIRAVGAQDRGRGPQKDTDADTDHCPSCGAPLDQVSMAGVCGYCDSKITGGDFDWVLSRIEQDEIYGR